eukprot:COSAG05_NODE_2976_length_2445_cov_118.753197_3_plen_110_part_00
MSCRQVTPDEDDKEEAALMTRMRAFYLSNPENMKKWAAKVQTEYGTLGMPGVDGELAPVYMTLRYSAACLPRYLPRRYNRVRVHALVFRWWIRKITLHTHIHTYGCVYR